MLSHDEEDFLSKIPDDKVVTVKPFDPKIHQIAEGIISKIHSVLPQLEVKHMGASALGISGQNDIDMYILSSPSDFDKYIPLLIPIFGEPKSRKYDSVAWDFEEENYPVELYLTDPNSEPMQRQIKIFETLRFNPVLRKEYEELKQELNGQSFREYQRKKYEFYNKVIETTQDRQI